MQLILTLMQASTTPVAGAVAEASWAYYCSSRYDGVDTVIDIVVNRNIWNASLNQIRILPSWETLQQLRAQGNAGAKQIQPFLGITKYRLLHHLCMKT